VSVQPHTHTHTQPTAHTLRTILNVNAIRRIDLHGLTQRRKLGGGAAIEADHERHAGFGGECVEIAAGGKNECGASRR
jgi:hypothetical protein